MACRSIASSLPCSSSLRNCETTSVARSSSATPFFLRRISGSRNPSSKLTTSFVSSPLSVSSIPLKKLGRSCCRHVVKPEAALLSSGVPFVPAPALLGLFVLARAAVSQLLSRLGQVFVNMEKRMMLTESDARLLAELKQGRGGRLLLNAVAAPCFAALSRSAGPGPLTVIAGGMARWLELYSAVLLIRVLLSWFPNIPWEKQPLLAIKDMCDPYLNLFRNILPPLFGALDLSPMLAFLVLGMLSSLLSSSA